LKKRAIGCIINNSAAGCRIVLNFATRMHRVSAEAADWRSP